MSDFTEDILKEKKCVELSKLCKARHLPVSGTKAVLIARLLNQVPPPAVTKTKAKAKGICKVTNAENKAIQTALKNRVAVVALKNKQGRYEHAETGFVFDPETKKVVGKQNGENLDRLNMTDVELCKQYNFQADEDYVDKVFSSEEGANRITELLKQIEDDESEDDE